MHTFAKNEKDYFLCLFVDVLTPGPDTPSIIGGGVMHLVGPCFSIAIENITCLFTDEEGDVTLFTDIRTHTLFVQL